MTEGNKGRTSFAGLGPSAIDRLVVERVFDRCHHDIEAAVAGSALPEEFLGALAANESGGRRETMHFEPAVYEHLKSVASGQTLSYGNLRWPQLSAALEENVATAAGQDREYLAAPKESRKSCARSRAQKIAGSGNSRARGDLHRSWDIT